MQLTDLSLALISGVFVIFAPCSYPLLPGYVAYYLGSKISTRKAIQGGLVCGLGLTTVFSTLGLVTYIMGSTLLRLIPYAHYLAATIIGVLGITMLLGTRYPRVYLRLRATRREGLPGLFLYGLTYGLASLACSAPVFISIMLYALTFGDITDGILMFLVFSIGMSFPLVVTTLLVARAGRMAIKRIVGATSKIQRVSGLLLIVLSIYLYLT